MKLTIDFTEPTKEEFMITTPTILFAKTPNTMNFAIAILFWCWDIEITLN